MGRVNAPLAAQDLVFGVKRLNRAFCSAVTETSNDHGRQKRTQKRRGLLKSIRHYPPRQATLDMQSKLQAP